jgi:hypothetical protein
VLIDIEFLLSQALFNKKNYFNEQFTLYWSEGKVEGLHNVTSCEWNPTLSSQIDEKAKIHYIRRQESISWSLKLLKDLRCNDHQCFFFLNSKLWMQFTVIIIISIIDFTTNCLTLAVLFSFLIIFTVGGTPLDGVSAHRKAFTYTQNITNTE